MSEVYTEMQTESRYSEKLTAMLGIVWSLEAEGVTIVSVNCDVHQQSEIHVSANSDLDGWAMLACGQHTEMVPFAEGRYFNTPYQRQIVVPGTDVTVFQLVYKEVE